jgi:hypothetical protein
MTKNERQSPSIWDQVATGVQNKGFTIISWNEVGEGALAATLADEQSVDPYAFFIGGPTDEELTAWGHESTQCYYFTRSLPLSQIVPGISSFLNTGTFLANRNTPNLEEYADFSQNAAAFIEEVVTQRLNPPAQNNI